jgi:hypothetical protein
MRLTIELVVGCHWQAKAASGDLLRIQQFIDVFFGAGRRPPMLVGTGLHWQTSLASATLFSFLDVLPGGSCQRLS